MPEFDLGEARALLARTPAALAALLSGLPEPWIRQTEGDGTWSPFDVVGHLVHGERTDWIPRLRTVLDHGDAVPFTPFDRFAQFEASTGKTLPQLLDEFAGLRRQNLSVLDALGLREEQLDRVGRHPELGAVTVRQLLATWVAHDLDHVVQVARVMARRYATDVGPWAAYLRVVR